MGTRAGLLRAGGEPLPLPETDRPSFTEWFLDVGPVYEGEQGLRPLFWGDLNSWLAGTGFRLSLADKRALLAMSREYLRWLRLGSDMMQPAPWEADERD